MSVPIHPCLLSLCQPTIWACSPTVLNEGIRPHAMLGDPQHRHISPSSSCSLLYGKHYSGKVEPANRAPSESLWWATLNCGHFSGPGFCVHVHNRGSAGVRSPHMCVRNGDCWVCAAHGAVSAPRGLCWQTLNQSIMSSASSKLQTQDSGTAGTAREPAAPAISHSLPPPVWHKQRTE